MTPPSDFNDDRGRGSRGLKRARSAAADRRRRVPVRPREGPFDDRIRAARLERGLSQGELAEAVGLTRQAVYAIESNRYPPNVTVALRLAQALGRHVEDLFGAVPAGAFLE